MIDVTGGEVLTDRGGVAPTPLFRRAKPDDALDLALDTFVQASRLDMQLLAAQLAVSPATLYRWYGSRGQLLDGVLARLATRFAATARADARGSGDDRVCDYARRIMTATSTFEPIRAFVQREPQLALRLILGRDGSVHRVLTAATREVIAETRASGEATMIDEHVHLIVSVATALVWATFMIGDEPQIDSAVELIAIVLASDRSA